MEIKLDKSHYGCNLIIEADNVKIVEDIEKRTYSKDENGKTNYNPERDIKDSALKMFSQVLEDMIYYRKSLKIIYKLKRQKNHFSLQKRIIVNRMHSFCPILMFRIQE